jgi:hypothetical protein
MAVGGKRTGQLVSQARIGVVVSWIRNGRHFAEEGFSDCCLNHMPPERPLPNIQIARISRRRAPSIALRIETSYVSVSFCTGTMPKMKLFTALS